MNRLINADALKDDILKSAVMIDDRGIQTGYEIAIELIKRQPTIDAVPIEWIEMRIRGLRVQLVNADADDKDLIWDLRTKIDELGGIAEYWRKEYETD